MNINTLPDAASLSQVIAGDIAASCETAIHRRDVFHLAISGGNSPHLCYEHLRSVNMDWPHIHIWFSDERCLPEGDTDRNDTMATQYLLAHVPIPVAQVHRIPAELGPKSGAAAYAASLAQAPPMDLVLLGMGEDGHTASLFPENPALQNADLAVPVWHSPKPPPERISMGFTTLYQAHHRFFLVTGEQKHDAFQRIKAGESLPAGKLADSTWYVDTAVTGTT